MKKYLVFSLVSSLFFMTTSCNDDDLLENDVLTEGPAAVGFQESAVQYPHFSDIGDVEEGIPVVFFGTGDGRTLTEDVTVGFEVASSSTAVEGQEFDFASSSRQITIPAGSSFASIPLILHTGSFDPTAKTVLTLNLVDPSGAVVYNKTKSIDVIFVGCLADLAGSYTVQITWNNGGNVGYRYDEVITQTAINTYRTKYVGGWGAATFTPQGYQFSVICGEVHLPAEQNLGQYSNLILPVSGDTIPNDGEVTSATEFYVSYDVNPYPGLTNRVYVNYYTKN